MPIPESVNLMVPGIPLGPVRYNVPPTDTVVEVTVPVTSLAFDTVPLKKPLPHLFARLPKFQVASTAGITPPPTDTVVEFCCPTMELPSAVGLVQIGSALVIPPLNAPPLAACHVALPLASVVKT